MADEMPTSTSDDSHLAGDIIRSFVRSMNRSFPYPPSTTARHPQHTEPAEHWLQDGPFPSADGSVVNDREYVYVLPLHQIRQVDYFHGTLPGLGPVAQMMEDEVDILASEMFSTRRYGRTVRAIITLQRRWRRKRLHHSRNTLGMLQSSVAGP